MESTTVELHPAMGMTLYYSGSYMELNVERKSKPKLLYGVGCRVFRV